MGTVQGPRWGSLEMKKIFDPPQIKVFCSVGQFREVFRIGKAEDISFSLIVIHGYYSMDFG